MYHRFLILIMSRVIVLLVNEIKTDIFFFTNPSFLSEENNRACLYRRAKMDEKSELL